MTYISRRRRLINPHSRVGVVLLLMMTVASCRVAEDSQNERADPVAPNTTVTADPAPPPNPTTTGPPPVPSTFPTYPDPWGDVRSTGFTSANADTFRGWMQVATGFGGLDGAALASLRHFVTEGGVHYSLIGVNGFVPTQEVLEAFEHHARAAEQIAAAEMDFTIPIKLDCGPTPPRDVSFTTKPASTQSQFPPWEAAVLFLDADLSVSEFIAPMQVVEGAPAATTNDYSLGISVSVIQDSPIAMDGMLVPLLSAAVEAFHSALAVELSPEFTESLVDEDELCNVSDMNRPLPTRQDRLVKLAAQVRDWVAISYGHAAEAARSGNPYSIYVGMAGVRDLPHLGGMYPTVLVVGAELYERFR